MESIPKRRNVPATRKQHSHYSPDKKAEVVTAYLALGNANLVEAVTKVPAGTVRSWKTEQWFKDLEAGIREEENLVLDVRLSKVVGKTLDLLEDRLSKGDFMYDPKTAQLIRKPVNADVLNKIGMDMFDRRRILRGERKEEEVNQVIIGDHLLKLAQQFVKIAKQQREPVVLNMEVIRDKEEQQRIPSEVRIGEELIETRVEQIPGETATYASGVLQTQEGQVNEQMSPDPQNRGMAGEGTSGTETGRWIGGRMVRAEYSDQVVGGSVLGRNESDTSSRSDSRPSGRDGVERSREDSPESGETTFQPNT